MSTWILQANPKLYDVDSALVEERVIYWRIPQHASEIRHGDRALIWRSGKQAGFVGWGVVLTEPKHYDLTGSRDPNVKDGKIGVIGECRAPLQVWPSAWLSKAEVAAVIPRHQIVVAPMGTVFRLTDEDLTALDPLLSASGFDLKRLPEEVSQFKPIVPEAEPEPSTIKPAGAKLTPALFLLSSTPDTPIEITIEGDALLLSIAERGSVSTFDESWDAVGVYLLIGNPVNPSAVLSAYVGKAQDLRTRVKTGHQPKEWTRCLLIQRSGLHPFNASDISWLERRLVDVLLEAPEIDLMNKLPPPIELVPDYKAEILERTVIAALGILGVLGAFTV